MNQVVATTQELGIREMLESIRWNHIDIDPIIQEEIKIVLPQVIEDVIKSVYANLEVKQ